VDRVLQQEDGGAGRLAAAATATAAEGSLLAILQRVAPQQRGRPREVLIAISNYNLVLSGQLPLWLQVCAALPCCPHVTCA
jgi:hypothetical protein